MTIKSCRDRDKLTMLSYVHTSILYVYRLNSQHTLLLHIVVTPQELNQTSVVHFDSFLCKPDQHPLVSKAFRLNG